MTTPKIDITPARVRAGTAQRRRGRERVKNILNASRKLLIKQGYANFTLRNVAKASGISRGNLNYYFKSKNDLFRSMLDDVLDKFRVAWEEKVNKASSDPKVRFFAFIDDQISDCLREESRQFFYQFWALSVHDPFVEQCREDAYAEFFDDARKLCGDVNPELPPAVLNNRTYMLMAQIEGLHIILGNQKSHPPNIKKFRKEFRLQTLALILATERS